MTDAPSPTPPPATIELVCHALLSAPMAIVCRPRPTSDWTEWTSPGPGQGMSRSITLDLVDVRTPRGDGLEPRRVLRGITLRETVRRMDGPRHYEAYAEWLPVIQWTHTGGWTRDTAELARVAEAISHAAWKLWMR